MSLKDHIERRKAEITHEQHSREKQNVALVDFLEANPEIKARMIERVHGIAEAQHPQQTIGVQTLAHRQIQNTNIRSPRIEM